jgi:hypothetical protein
MINLKSEIERDRIMAMGKRSRQALLVFNELLVKPVITVSEVQSLTKLSPKAAGDLVSVFVKSGILKEKTGYQRNRIFVFAEYLELFK